MFKNHSKAGKMVRLSSWPEGREGKAALLELSCHGGHAMESSDQLGSAQHLGENDRRGGAWGQQQMCVTSTRRGGRGPTQTLMVTLGQQRPAFLLRKSLAV